MSDDTPVERRLRARVEDRQQAEVLTDIWPNDVAYAEACQHTQDIDLGREAIALLREWLSEDMGDLGLRAHKRRARALLTRCEQDGPR